METPARTLQPSRLMPQPLHLIALVATLPLFLGALMADIAYGRSEQIQWTNFASWLLVGAQVMATIALLLAAIDHLRGRRMARGGLYLLLLAVAWVLGLVNNFVHAMDAFQKMPQATICSLLCTLIVLGLVWWAFWGHRMGRAPA
ncbi:MAG: hypothetical protein Q4F49_02500 [Pseudoxanthomonas suwonensis]|nr:hypothetical protein [Pseudoxanthomonas suwonensis]